MSSLDRERGIARQSPHCIGREGVDRNVAAALAQFERLSSFVRNDGQANASQLHLLAPVLVVAFDDDFSIGLRTAKLKWPGADGMLGHFVATAERHNADCSIG